MTPQVPDRARRLLAMGTAIASLCLGGACSSPPATATGSIYLKPAATGQPQGFAEFKEGGDDRFIRCTAEIETESADVFGFDLAKKHHVIPIKLVITLKDDAHPVGVREGKMNAVLFSESGAVFESVDPEELRGEIDSKNAIAFTRSLFNGGDMQDLGSSGKLGGYLYFKFVGPYVNKDELTTMTHADELAYSTIPSRSTLQFSYEGYRNKTDREVRTINVGVN